MRRASVHETKSNTASDTRHSSLLQRGSNSAHRPTIVPPIVHEVLNSPGQPLDAETRAYMEPRFGHDFSKVRVHADGKAGEAAGAVGAAAFTSGRSIVFAPDRYTPENNVGKQLIAHELTHVLQQRAGFQRTDRQAIESAEHDADQLSARVLAGSGKGRSQHRPAVAAPAAVADRAPLIQCFDADDEIADAGVPETLPGGVPEPPQNQPLAQMANGELGPEYQAALARGDTARADEVDEEIWKRLTTAPPGLLGSPRGPAPVTGGAGMVTPEVALELLNNMSRGEPPFKPELGKGGCSWFTIEGNPFTSVKPNQTIPVQVEIAKGSQPLIFREADLVKIFEAEAENASALVEAQVRAEYGLSPVAKLSNRLLKTIKYRVRSGAQESVMWTRVGEKIAASAQKVGEVILEQGSRFSETPGKFAVVADASKITLKGGTTPLVDALAKQGKTAEPVIVEAAEALATKMKWAGRVRNVFRYGGRIMIVVAVAADAIKIYYATDRKKAVVESAGGWTGATLASSAFAAWFAPADVAGPWAWAAHGVGTLIAGGVGYWIGSETTRTIYELVAE